MKAMLYADWMNLRRSMKAMLIVVVVIALASTDLGKTVLSFVPFMLVHAVAYGARNAHEQRLMPTDGIS